MILIHIIPNHPDQTQEIVDMLIGDQLILNAIIQDNITVRQKNKAGQLENVISTLIMGKTKGLLFPIIDKALQGKYKHDMPTLYSLPIVHMDWEQAEELVQETSKI